MRNTILSVVVAFAFTAISGCQNSSDTVASADPQSTSNQNSIAQQDKDLTDAESVSTHVDNQKPDESPAYDDDATEAVAKKSVHDHQADAGEQHGPGAGRGMGFQGGRGPRAQGGGGMGGFRADMTTIHSMFDDRDKIRRTVKLLPDGAEALTESGDKDIVAFIQDHVPNMDSRVLGNEPLPPMTFHPVFVGLIKNAEKYTLDYEETDKGVKVTYQSDDPYVVMLVQEHAKLVSRFIKNGHDEIHSDYELPEFNEKAAVAKAKALTARGVLFKKLSGRLTEVMKSKGPTAAIEVCSQEASKIAEAVGKKQGVKIGRTAVKLRNEKNQPPSWAKSLIEESPSHGTFVDLPEDRVGALLPIHLQAKCVACHGPADKIADEVGASLAKFYPNDKATGFNEGDLRGWFWVEVPIK